MTRGIPQSLIDTLTAYADQADAETTWPAASLDALGQAGVWRWSIPTQYGGDGLGGVELLRRYRDLASACLTTAFILSQREAACRRIRDHGNPDLREHLLPALARGERFATVGLSQLTTARQHTGPSLSGCLEDDFLELNGIIPWVTGAAKADHVIVGNVLGDNRQVLAVLPSEMSGLKVDPPLDLMAVRGSLTAEIRCSKVRIGREWLLAGPALQLLQTGKGGAGGLETSCLALGLSRAAIDYVQKEAEARSPLRGVADGLDARWERLWKELEQVAGGGNTPDAVRMRSKANVMVLHATQAALTAAKGTGFVRPHPAQRWARQALFFLVWSCPWPAASAMLDTLASDACV